MANRFSQILPGAEYIHQPLDIYAQVGLAKDKMYQDEVDSLNKQLENINGIEAFWPGDKTKLKEMQDQLYDQVNNFAKGDVGDINTQNKIHQTIGNFTRDPIVKTIIGNTKQIKDIYKQKEDAIKGKYYTEDYWKPIQGFINGMQNNPESWKNPRVDESFSLDPDSNIQEAQMKLYGAMKAGQIGGINWDAAKGMWSKKTGIEADKIAQGMMAYYNSDQQKQFHQQYVNDGMPDILSDDEENALIQDKLKTFPNATAEQLAGILEQANENAWFVKRNMDLGNNLAFSDTDLGNWDRANQDAKEKANQEAFVIPGGLFKPANNVTKENPYYTDSDGVVRVKKNSAAETSLALGILPGVGLWEQAKGVFQSIFGDNDKLDTTSEGYKNLETQAKDKGFVKPEMKSQKDINKGVSEYLNFRHDATLQGTLIVPNINSNYRQNFNEAFYPDKNGKGMIGNGLASNFKYADEDGKIYTGKGFIQQYNGKPVSYSGTYEDVLSPHEFGSTELTIQDGNQVKKLIQSPTLSAMQTPQYYMNGILRAAQSSTFNKQGFAYNEFEIPSNSASGAPAGHYTSEELNDGNFRVTNITTNESGVYFLDPTTGNLKIKE